MLGVEFVRVMEREHGVDERPRQHDSRQQKREAPQREGLCPGRNFEPRKDRAHTRASADDGEHENGEAAFVLGQILPVNLCHAAMGDHPESEDELEPDAKIPGDQEPRHTAQLGDIQGQQSSNGEPCEDRQEESRPRGNDAEKQRPSFGFCRHLTPPVRIALKPGARQ